MTPFAIGARIRITRRESPLFLHSGVIVEQSGWPNQWRVKLDFRPEPILFTEWDMEVLG